MNYYERLTLINKYTLGNFLQRVYPSVYDEFKSVEDVYKKESRRIGVNNTSTNNFLNIVSSRISDKLFNAVQEWKYNFTA